MLLITNEKIVIVVERYQLIKVLLKMIFSELEVTELAAEYLGQHGKLAYQTALFLPTFIGLLAYAQDFNASFQSQIWPNCPAYIPVLFFGIIFVPFSCMDLVEQVRIISCMFTL